jgi:hypothetical protein
MPDAWETKHGLDPNDPSDADADADGDGVSNKDEFEDGTNPQDSTDVKETIDGASEELELGISKLYNVIDPKGLFRGGQLIYTIQIANQNSNGQVYTVVIEDQVPETYFAFEEMISMEIGITETRTIDNYDVQVDGRTRTWSKIEIPAGQKLEINYRVRVSTEAEPKLYSSEARITEVLADGETPAINDLDAELAKLVSRANVVVNKRTLFLPMISR